MRRVLIGAALAACAVVTLALATAAGQSATPPQQDQRPVFRGSAVFVNVDVYPRRDGRVIEGLTKDDFEVLEDGKPQPVEKFEFIRVAPFTPDEEKRDPNTVAESMRLAADPHNRVFVIFLDTYNVSLPGSYYSREPLVTFLNRTIGPNDLFAVMTPDVPVERLTFARRTETIAGELEKFWFWGESDRLTEMPRTPDEHRMSVCRGGLGMLKGMRQERSAVALERMVAKLDVLRDARKNILFVSEGWKPTPPLPPGVATAERPSLPRVGTSLGNGMTSRLTAGADEYGNPDRNTCELETDRLARIDFERRFKDLLGQAQRANVAFYPIDVGGLKTGLPEARHVLPADPALNAQAIFAMQEKMKAGLDTLHTLGNETGGYAIANTNDLTSGVKKISDDLSAFYLLGYYSTNTTADGKYRRIEVRMKTPGVKVSARRGYSAPTPEMLKSEAAAATRPVRERTAADDARERLGRIRTDARLHTAAVASATGLDVIVELSGPEMASYRWNGGAKVIVSVAPKDGDSTPVTAGGAIAPGSRSAMVTLPVADASGKAWRVTARAVSGAESVEDALDVVAPAAAGLGEPVVYRAMPSPRSVPQPSADPLFRRTERIHVRWGGTGVPGTGFENRVARLLGPQNDPLPVPVSLTEQAEGGRAVLAADLVLAPLAPGDYVIEVSATRGGEKVTSYVAFRITR